MSSVNSTSSSSNIIRLTGLATGLDTDTMVKQMIAAENLKVDKMKQDKQYVQWRQDAFRDIIKDLKDLYNNSLYINSPDATNVMKSAAYTGSTIKSGDESVITATTLPGVVNGTSEITVTKMAKSAKLMGDKIDTSTVSIGTATDWNGKGITFKLNGVTDITIPTSGDGSISGVNGESNLADKINEAINASGLNGKVKAVVDTAKHTISFDVLTNDSVKVTSETGGTGADKLDTIKDKELNPTTSTKLSDLGIKNNSTIYIKQGVNTSSAINIDPNQSLQDLINNINNTTADGTTNGPKLSDQIKVTFSDLTKSLVIETRNTGSSQSLQISLGTETDASTNLGILGLNVAAKPGQDAEVSIKPPGSNTATTVVKSSNSFTIDNVTYNIQKEGSTTLTTSSDAQKSVDKIKAFIEKYNALAQKINDKLTEKKDYNYKPLTDDQKKAMDEDEIKAWEAKAKQGILKNDGDLQKILQSMRSAFMDNMDAVGIRLKDIGIDTYGGLEAVSKPGQMKIDEATLKKALEERGDQVMKLFTASAPTTGTDEYKYNNTGIFQRLKNVVNDVAIKSDGALLKKAGYVGSLTEFTNDLTKKIQDQDKAISEMTRKIANKETKYYQMFAKLESAMNQMNAQQSWLTQQLGG